MISLYRAFLKIRKLGWIKSLRKGSTGIGYTFETLLGKKEENFELPDYKSVEIKVKRRFSKGFITLFNATPDNSFFVMQKIYDKYGFPESENSKNKVFMGSIYSKKITKLGKYKFSLLVDWRNKCVRLLVFNGFLFLINDEVSWSFDLLEEKLNRKLKCLALVKTDIKTENGEDYFRYSYIRFYNLKNFQVFLKLIDEGIIRITFKVNLNKSGKKMGMMHDHGTGFDINEKDLLKLYEEAKF